MENASKALLIAGSVLIAILLIAVGMRVFNSTAGITDEVKTTMDTTAIATFNNQFTDFVGTNVSKAKVKTLLNKIIASNAKNTNHKVKVYESSSSSDTVATVFLNTKLTTAKYNISIKKTDSNGYITEISIEGINP